MFTVLVLGEEQISRSTELVQLFVSKNKGLEITYYKLKALGADIFRAKTCYHSRRE